MTFQVSPGVQVKEIDLTSIIPSVSTTRAGFAGNFNKRSGWIKNPHH